MSKTMEDIRKLNGRITYLQSYLDELRLEHKDAAAREDDEWRHEVFIEAHRIIQKINALKCEFKAAKDMLY